MREKKTKQARNTKNQKSFYIKKKKKLKIQLFEISGHFLKQKEKKKKERNQRKKNIMKD